MCVERAALKQEQPPPDNAPDHGHTNLHCKDSLVQHPLFNFTWGCPMASDAFKRVYLACPWPRLFTIEHLLCKLSRAFLRCEAGKPTFADLLGHLGLELHRQSQFEVYCDVCYLLDVGEFPHKWVEAFGADLNSKCRSAPGIYGPHWRWTPLV